ncbi:MAG TPA: trehalose-phosphatase [Candidatus Corynebacterium gallistercoris]|uniref:Trehalose 6-phosphate phosphatase n=1 Tax=Candidatus Corynebacterium gallistercoris TaxID=2838530 RepID=A0A9D1UQN8_9CORY|nr:trehalose-phosphatase [Candidatus Corynebacterium gallistercoris]
MVNTVTRELSPEDMGYLAAAKHLLVAMDFDGTLAHFSDDPTGVRAVPGAIEALVQLATLPGTEAMIISGRNVDQLTHNTGLPAAGDGAHVMLVGSHGAEPAAMGLTLAEAQVELREALAACAEAIAADTPGAWVEHKPASIALHTRKVAGARGGVAAQEKFEAEARALGAHVTHGKDILDVAVLKSSKGEFIAGYRASHAAEELVVVFAGDDVTDETVLQTLDYSRDLGIRVGGGETGGNRRLGTPEQVRDFLVELVQRRGGAMEDPGTSSVSN